MYRRHSMKNVVRKKTVAKIGVSLMAVLGVFAIIGGISFASGEGNKPFLDDYIEYGIVCNHLNQTADMETNFVAGEYAGNGQHTGNTVSEDKANAAGKIRIGEVLRSNGEKGEAKHVLLRNKDTVVTVDPEVKEEVKAFLRKVRKYAVSLLGEKDVILPDEVRDQNNYLIDVTSVNKKTVYVEADKLAIALNEGRIQNGGLKIKLRAEQTVVFNIKEDKKFCIPRYSVTVTEGKKTKDEIAQTVIWNMPNLNNLEIASDNLAATVIAPQAFVRIRVTGEGWLVCDTVVKNDSEWHMIYRDLPDTKVTPTPKETKKPTPKPTVKPKPTKTPEPEPTDTVKDDPKDPEEPTPTPKETEKPTSTPTATPKETEKPTSTPAVTPEETEKPTPTPTATPKETDKPTSKPTATPEETEKPTPDPTETPEPVRTATPDPEVTETPEPTPTSSATVTPGETPDVTPDVTPGTTPLDSEPTPDPEATPEVTTPGEEPTATPDGNAVVPPDGSPTPAGSKTIKDDDPPTTSLSDPGVPKAKMTPSPITKIKDGEVPLAPGVPETGDDTNLFVPILVMGVSAIALIVVLVLRKKKSE